MSRFFLVPESIEQFIAGVEDRSNEVMKRVAITFKNGYSLSIIRGEYSYGGPTGLFEIAVIDTNGELNGSLLDEDDQGDSVLGYCTPEKVTHYVSKIAHL